MRRHLFLKGISNSLKLLCLIVSPQIFSNSDYQMAWNLGVQDLSLGETHSCVIDSEGLKCWGNNFDGSVQETPINKPTQVCAGGFHNCVLGNSKVHCWGENQFGQIDVPPLKNPKALSCGGAFSCALDESGVHCWGYNQFGQTSPPKVSIKKPSSLTTNNTTSCVLDENTIKCWGLNKNLADEHPTLKEARQISLGDEHACVLDSEGVKCWGKNDFGQINVPTLQSPSQLSVSGHNTCAIDKLGVHCWGPNKDGQTNVPELSNPTHVTTGRFHSCASDSKGLHCWGRSNYNRLEAPLINTIKESSHCQSLSPQERLSYLSCNIGLESLKITSLYLYKIKSELIHRSIKIMERSPRQSYFILLLLRPFIESQSSEVFEKHLNPKFRNFMNKLEEMNGDNPYLRTSERDGVALHLSTALVKTLVDTVDNQENKKILGDLTLELSLRIPTKEKYPEAISLLDQHQAIFRDLEHNPLTRPVALSLKEVLDKYFKIYP